MELSPVGFVQIVPIMTWILDSEFCAWFGSLAFILTGEPDAKTSLKGKEQIQWTEKEEEILDPVMYFENRSKAVIGLKSQALTHPYPHKFEVTHTHDQYIKEFNDKCKENNKFDETTTVSIAGNLVIQVSWNKK